MNPSQLPDAPASTFQLQPSASCTALLKQATLNMSRKITKLPNHPPPRIILKRQGNHKTNFSAKCPKTKNASRTALAEWKVKLRPRRHIDRSNLTPTMCKHPKHWNHPITLITPACPWTIQQINVYSTNVPPQNLQLQAGTHVQDESAQFGGSDP